MIALNVQKENCASLSLTITPISIGIRLLLAWCLAETLGKRVTKVHISVPFEEAVQKFTEKAHMFQKGPKSNLQSD